MLNCKGDNCSDAPVNEHSPDCLFGHFLSYTGWHDQSPHILSMLEKAYFDGYNGCFPSWVPPEELPITCPGDAIHVMLTLERPDGSRWVRDAYYVNFPLDTTKEDLPDWTILDCDGAPVSLVGWAEMYSHDDFDGYYQLLDQSVGKVLAWMPVRYPLPWSDK